ncbi:MAG: hypothetical protein ABIG03_04475 [Candidatus Eisenbacteria bacterium]
MSSLPRIVTAAVLLAATASSPAFAGGDLRWESWGENAPAGGAAEGAHVWISHGLYQRGAELGLGRGESAGLAFAIMAAWEVYEVNAMDAKGVSVQDLVANSAGIAAGLMGLDVRYSYATYGRPETSEECPWLGVPGLPRNDFTHALELVHDGWTLGFKYMGQAGDVVVGTTSMPVQPGEWGEERVIAHVGREWDNGWHAAAGYDGLGEVCAGGGYRMSLWGLGIDLTALGDAEGLGLGFSCFLDYGPVFGR